LASALRLSTDLANRLSSLAKSITPVILTLDEAPNIRRSLEKLRWAERIVVVDSFSMDETEDVCGAFSNVVVFQRKFDSHAEQWNFAIQRTGITTPWILAIDADYLLSDGLVDAMVSAIANDMIVGWRCHFRYSVFGRPLRGTLYPPVVALFRAGRGVYEQDGHTQRLKVNGSIRDIPGVIYHDDRKPLGRWFASQGKYARLEADNLLSNNRKSLGLVDRIRLIAWPAPLLAGFYVLFVKGCILDGWAGWYYALQRVLAEILLALELIDRRQRDRVEG
jgi:glycosyltransferase involved in cell wall biosynthesis